MIEESTHQRNGVIEWFAQHPCASLGIDAGIIERHHSLDVMILAPYSNLGPSLYDFCEQDALTSDDYGHIITGMIQELKTKGVRICSIVGDDLPTQAASLAHWS
jgi:hypothetical protein